MSTKKSYYYQHYTWPEIKEVVKRQPVVVLPVGSVEDHGKHLPLDVDNFIITSICEEAARRAKGEILLLPPVSYGFEEHHMDMPGTIDIAMEHMLHFVLDITRSVAHHGFKRILLADGHGSNMPILDLVARRTTSRPRRFAELSFGQVWRARPSQPSGNPGWEAWLTPANLRPPSIYTWMPRGFR